MSKSRPFQGDRGRSLRYASCMSTPKTAAQHLAHTDVKDEAILRALENAPIDAEAFSPEEVAAIEVSIAEPRGAGRSTAEMLAEIAERAKSAG